nr:unnamed protein product [Haemonchus contortus]
MDPFPLTWLRHAGNYGDFTSSRLVWDYHDWNGTPIKFLLNNSELQNYENGILKWGVLKLESLNSLATKRNDVDSNTEVTHTIPRKRDLEGATSSSTKRTKGGN